MESGGDELYIFRKENVAATEGAPDQRRAGRLCLLRQAPSPASDAVRVLLRWAPYVPPGERAPACRAPGTMVSAPVDLTQELAFELELGQVFAVRRHLPAIGLPRVRLTKQGGEALPELVFRTGGLRDFLSALRSVADLEPDDIDPDLYYVRAHRGAPRADGAEPPRRLRSLRAPLHLKSSAPLFSLLTQSQPDAVQLGVPPALKADRLRQPPEPAATTTTTTTTTTESQGVPENKPNIDDDDDDDDDDEEGEAYDNTGEAFTFLLLERFAQVTRLARAATHSLSRYPGGRRAPLHARRIPSATASATARQQRRVSVDTEPSGDLIPPHFRLDTHYPSYRSLRSAPAVSRDTFQRTRAVDPLALKRAIFAGGLEPDARRIAWPYLLGVLPWSLPPEQEPEQREQLAVEYATLRQQWSSISEKQERRFTQYRERRFQIEKDVVRTDRTLELFHDERGPAQQHLFHVLLTHTFFNFDLGYCQGMSDLAAPVVYVMGGEDEVLAFWCFAALMDVFERNFREDQSGMREELSRLASIVRHVDPELYAHCKRHGADNFFCCFRWLLVRFKRELPFEQLLRLWDVLWAAPPAVGGGVFHLYVAAALLVLHREVILDYDLAFDELLSYTNRMAMRIDLDLALARAEMLFKEFGLPDDIRLEPPETQPTSLTGLELVSDLASALPTGMERRA
ncbi:hypothetical protein CDCA_CDCA04G1424 [Cyanidium caldarium]|uniref:Rab-GAP TBC domain-containing protein n=1 Tax=Cyanidium caldarium TaxID=2771 RepID=A0AAV9ITB6_CYACA|nr:hypothetical protein CDCA_CDCA04G1424 [Cyanidium caldarium]